MRLVASFFLERQIGRDMSTNQDSIGRLAIAHANISTAKRSLTLVLDEFYGRDGTGRDSPLSLPGRNPAVIVRGDIAYSIERLNLAIQDLQVVLERVQDD